MTLLVDPGAVGHVDLKPVGAVLELVAGHFASFDRAVENLNPARHGKFGSITLERISAGGGDPAGGSKNAGTRNGAFFNGLLDAHVTVSRAFGFDIANRSEALIEGTARGIRGACGAKSDAGFENIGVIAAFGGIFAP